MALLLLEQRSVRVFRALSAEFFATFIFIFAITCSIINFKNTVLSLPSGTTTAGVSYSKFFLLSGNVIGALCVAFAGIIVCVCFGDISGAHFNPSVTLSAMIFGLLPIPLGIAYIVTQLCASCVACLVLMVVFGGNNTILEQVLAPATPSYLSLYKVFNMETLFTFIFITTIFMTAWSLKESPFSLSIRYPRQKDQQLEEAAEEKSPDAETACPTSLATGLTHHVKATIQAQRSKNAYTPLVIGMTLAFLTLTGASVNPARAFGPAVISWKWYGQWTPWAGCITGSVAACAVHWALFGDRLFEKAEQRQQDDF